jgi:phosphoadenosine phosphosulfate reductase
LEIINTLKQELQIEASTLPQLLRKLTDFFPGQVTFSTSFGLEDQVITHIIASEQIPVSIFTLDTGRQFQETYSTWAKTLIHYGIEIKSYTPDFNKVSELLTKKGPSSFYESIENRKECCEIRKLEPLRNALKGKKIWITGIRADQSSNRAEMNALEYDSSHDIIKFHPLFDWNFEKVKNYAIKNAIPYNPLHDKGFVSIGCAPCTRAISIGEDFRAGRWWWESKSSKECGLHSISKEKKSFSILQE